MGNVRFLFDDRVERSSTVLTSSVSGAADMPVENLQAQDPRAVYRTSGSIASGVDLTLDFQDPPPEINSIALIGSNLTGHRNSMRHSKSLLAVTWVQLGTGTLTPSAWTLETDPENGRSTWVLTDSSDPGSRTHVLGQNVPCFDLTEDFAFAAVFKAGTLPGVRLLVADVAGGVTNSVLGDFNLTTGAVIGTPTSAGTFTGPQASVTALGDGWYLCKLSGRGDSGGSYQFSMRTLNGSFVAGYTGDGTGTIRYYNGWFRVGAVDTPETVITTLTDAGALFRVRASINADWDAPDYDSGTLYAALEEDLTTWPRLNRHHLLDEALRFRFWRVSVLNGGNPAGFVEASRLMAGLSAPYAINRAWEAELGYAEESGVRARSLNIEFPALAESEAFGHAFELLRRRGSKDGVFYVDDDMDTLYPHRRSFYARLRQLSPIVQRRGLLSGNRKLYSHRYRVEEWI